MLEYGVYCDIYITLKGPYYNIQYVMFIVAYITLQRPLQCTICGVYLWHILHYKHHSNIQHVVFIVAYITLQYTICDVYIMMTITMDNMWRLLWHILHYNDHYNVQYVAFIVAYIALQRPLQ
jgi:hypothetical protein